MDKITINEVLEALKVIGTKMELIDSRNISGVTQELLNIAGSDLKIVGETDLEEKEERNSTYYFGKSKDIENAILESENSPRLDIEDGYVRLNLPEVDVPMLQFSISNPNDEYNMVTALWGNSTTSAKRIDDTVDLKAVLSEIIDNSTDEKSVEDAKKTLEFLDNLTEAILDKETKKEVNNDNRNAPYYKIAKQALMNWGNKDSNYVGLSEEEALKIINNEPFGKIEADVGALGSINYAFENLASEMELSEEERADLSKMIFGESKNSEKIVQILIEKAENKDKDEIVLNMLSAVHDGWVKDNGKKFFARDKKYQHLPLELIGWKEVEADLLFVGPIAESIGIDIDEKKLEEAYNKRVEQFKADRGIKSNNDLRKQISKGAQFYPALKGQDDIIFALSNQAFVSSFVLKEKIEDVLKENESVFDLSNKNIVHNMYDFAYKFNVLSMINDGYDEKFPSFSKENRYHLSTEDKQSLLETASLIKSKYDKIKKSLHDEVYEEKHYKIGFQIAAKKEQKHTDKGVSYKDIVEVAKMITDFGYPYGDDNFFVAKRIIEEEVADAKMKESLKSLKTKGKDERKDVIESLLAEYDLKELLKYLSDDDLEVVVEIKGEEITKNDSIIIEKKNRTNVLPKREQLMKKLADQEKTLKSQEREIQSLDNDIKRLESRKVEK